MLGEMMMSFVDNTTWSSSTFDFISFGFASSFFISRVNIPFQYFSVLRIVSSAKPAPSRETLPLTKFMSSFFRQHHKLEVKWGNSICWFSFSRSSFLALKHKVHRSIQTKASGFFYNFRPDGIIRFTVCGFFSFPRGLDSARNTRFRFRTQDGDGVLPSRKQEKNGIY